MVLTTIQSTLLVTSCTLTTVLVVPIKAMVALLAYLPLAMVRVHSSFIHLFLTILLSLGLLNEGGDCFRVL